MYLQLLSNNPKSSIIIHPNRSHYLQQNECNKIKFSDIESLKAQLMIDKNKSIQIYRLLIEKIALQYTET